jgi:hypothetical protein
MDILDVTFFANEPRHFIYPATSTAKQPFLPTTNPHEIKDAPSRDQKLGMRCAV